MIREFSDNLMDKFDDVIFEYIEMSLTEKFISYVIDSKYRQSVGLRSWIEEQIENKSEELYAYAAQIENSDDLDEQMRLILRHVKYNFKYLGDVATHKTPEYWQTAEESTLSNTGDCEDGAILMYVLARTKGIPANRLMLMTGNVKANNTAGTGGHCWLAYKQTNYPMAWCFVDWCYYYNGRDLQTTPKFHIIGKKIIEVRFYGIKVQKVASNYYSIWFCFNEDISTNKF